MNSVGKTACAPDSESCAPVALFAYARPEHLRRTVESLRANAEASQTALTVFCDAPKKPEHANAVATVRRYADGIEGFASVEVVKRDRNLGLAASIIDGVSRLATSHGRVIVVEDDLLLSPHFLRYMNDGLDRYVADNAVASIHGYCYPVGSPLPETFFLRGADCWGWATWSRAWNDFRPDGASLLAELRAQRLTREFDMDGTYPFTRMLADQIAGRNDSWAIRWHASCFLANRLTLYPGRSLVHNIGNDASGTHSAATDTYVQDVASERVKVDRLPLQASAAARQAFCCFFRGQQVTTLQRAWRRVKRIASRR